MNSLASSTSRRFAGVAMIVAIWLALPIAASAEMKEVPGANNQTIHNACAKKGSSCILSDIDMGGGITGYMVIGPGGSSTNVYCSSTTCVQTPTPTGGTGGGGGSPAKTMPPVPKGIFKMVDGNATTLN
ncbi:hypothetical protein [Dongia rigui]|uniref:Uncharacterized protein n=1 Tax=Dongia rigui TaxID=940149 RepID=A0ABU5E4V1_9PROT|nr:hypothetical protein [Dongia rigui]MDY0873901.1 hypothetical protein [Dongia rigui]